MATKPPNAARATISTRIRTTSESAPHALAHDGRRRHSSGNMPQRSGERPDRPGTMPLAHARTGEQAQP